MQKTKDRAVATYVYSSILLCIIIFSVLIRIYARARISKFFGLDDWMILVTLVRFIHIKTIVSYVCIAKRLHFFFCIGCGDRRIC